MANQLRLLLATAAVVASLIFAVNLVRSFGESGRSLRSSESATVPTRQELGRSTWTLLHRAAAKYDAEPTMAQQKQMRDFIMTLGDLYPCDECAAHFRKMLAKTPPAVESSEALSQWLCERHNEVNVRLGKPSFTCSPAALKERWGDCGCSEGPAANS